jgi:hypothetical protein
MFVDGEEFDEHFETGAGLVRVLSLIEIDHDTLRLRDLWIYPVTGTRSRIGTREMLQIVRVLEARAISQGLTAYSVEAVRVYTDKPERKMLISRRLR